MLLPMSKPYPFLYILWRTIINFTLRLRCSCKSGEATIRVTVATYWLSLCASNKSYKCQKYDHKNLHHKFLWTLHWQFTLKFLKNASVSLLELQNEGDLIFGELLLDKRGIGTMLFWRSIWKDLYWEPTYVVEHKFLMWKLLGHIKEIDRYILKSFSPFILYKDTKNDVHVKIWRLFSLQ